MSSSYSLSLKTDSSLSNSRSWRKKRKKRKSRVRLSGASQGHGVWWLEGQGPWNFQEHVLPHS